jgi:hypothetical protein
LALGLSGSKSCRILSALAGSAGRTGVTRKGGNAARGSGRLGD